MPPAALAGLIKAVPVRLTGTAPIARAISTAGGIALDEIDDHFMLRRLPGVFVAGEMLDWEAPTGGYLLQASLRDRRRRRPRRAAMARPCRLRIDFAAALGIVERGQRVAGSAGRCWSF